MTRIPEALHAVRRDRTFVRHRLAFLFLAFTCAARLIAGPLEDAARFESSGDTAAALREYRSWLVSNQTDPRFRDTLLHVTGLVPDVSGAIGLLSGLVPELSDGAAKHLALTTLAAVEELDGRYADAQRHYEEASYAIPGKKDYASLLESAGLLFSLGDTVGAEVRARAIMLTCDEQDLLSATAALYARIFTASGRFRDGIDTLEKIRKTVPGKETPSLLFLLTELYRAERNETEADTVRAELLARFPESPESLILSGKHVPGASAPALFPEPSLLLEFPRTADEPQAVPEGNRTAGAEPAGNGKAGPETTASGPVAAGSSDSKVPAPAEQERGSAPAAQVGSAAATGSGTTGSETILIQTGSYLRRENAQEMASRLKTEGFDAEIRTVEVGEKTYHRVFVPASRSVEEARTVQQRLKDRGVEGFLVFMPE
jgi:cell division protein FtsN